MTALAFAALAVAVYALAILRARRIRARRLRERGLFAGLADELVALEVTPPSAIVAQPQERRRA